VTFRLFMDVKDGIFERLQSLPNAQSSVLWAHVLTSLVASLISVVVVVVVLVAARYERAFLIVTSNKPFGRW
jgi:ABC-2 type transport system permease protein